MIAVLMSELHQQYSEIMSMPVHAAFDLLSAHAKNNERPH